MIGTWLHWAIFGGDFPGDILIPRLYAVHILIFPGIMLALIGLHLALVWFQKHTQFPGPGATEKNVVGVRVMPVFAVKSGAFFAMVLGIMGLMGGLLQINPIWQLGPYKPSQVSAGSQPDFYLMWTDGLIRLWPAWELYIGRYTVPAAVAVALIMGVIFLLLIVYPWIEKRVTGDDAHHNLLQRPRDAPVRTGIGAMAIAFYMVLTYSAMNDIIAYKFHISLNATTWMGRIGMVVLPPLVFFIAYRWAVALQRSDRAGARARRGDGHHHPPAARRLHRAAPAAGPGRRPRPPDSAGVPGQRGAQADEQAGRRRRTGPRQLPDRRPGRRSRRTNAAEHATEARARTALKERQAITASSNGQSD